MRELIADSPKHNALAYDPIACMIIFRLIYFVFIVIVTRVSM